jgi:RsiW-degrading membrane proteinase PrsW (M82 family)
VHSGFIPLHVANDLLYLAAVAIAVVIALLFLAWVRHMEVYQKESWGMVLRALLIGAGITAVGATVLVLLGLPLDDFGDFQPFGATVQGALIAVLVAPIVEETVKVSPLFALRKHLHSLENALVYGAAIGLGFAMVENMLYFYGEVYTSGAVGLALGALARAFTSTVIHMSTTAIAGFGVGMLITKRKVGNVNWFAYVAAAMVLHAIFNLLASASTFVSDQLTKDFVNLIFGAVIGGLVAWYALVFMRNKIRELDLEMETRRKIGSD